MLSPCRPAERDLVQVLVPWRQVLEPGAADEACSQVWTAAVQALLALTRACQGVLLGDAELQAQLVLGVLASMQHAGCQGAACPLSGRLSKLSKLLLRCDLASCCLLHALHSTPGSAACCKICDLDRKAS